MVINSQFQIIWSMKLFSFLHVISANDDSKQIAMGLRVVITFQMSEINSSEKNGAKYVEWITKV